MKDYRVTTRKKAEKKRETAGEPLLMVDGLRLGYGENVVIDSADFCVEDKDFLCVVGANGSGKSTLIKGILGLIKPLNGRVVFGQGLRQKEIGYLPQEAKIAASFPATVMEIVRSGTLGRMGMRPFYSVKEQETALSSLETLGLVDLADTSFDELSGGQKQKVLLARSLAATSKILILDEPSNNLDYRSRKEFYQVLHKLNQQGLTIIMITHDLDIEDLIGNKVVAVKEGEVMVVKTEEYLGGFR